MDKKQFAATPVLSSELTNSPNHAQSMDIYKTGENLAEPRQDLSHQSFSHLVTDHGPENPSSDLKHNTPVIFNIQQNVFNQTIHNYAAEVHSEKGVDEYDNIDKNSEDENTSFGENSSKTSDKNEPTTGFSLDHLPSNAVVNLQQNVLHQTIVKELHDEFVDVRWVVEKRLGKGTFGVIHLVTSKDDPSLKLARKEILLEDAHNQEKTNKVFEEVEILKRLNHPNIVKYRESRISNDKSCLFIYMDYISNGSLHEFIKLRGKLTENQCREFAHQLLSGIQYLHDNGTIHRDIKPANILLNEHNSVKIADFGVSKLFMDLSLATTVIGTTVYTAKEVFSGKYGRKCDVWSLGIVLLEMLNGHNPWSQYEKPQQVMYAICVKNKLPDYQCLKVSKNLKNFLSLVFKDEQDRPHAETLLNHNWFKCIQNAEAKVKKSGCCIM